LRTIKLEKEKSGRMKRQRDTLW